VHPNVSDVVSDVAPGFSPACAAKHLLLGMCRPQGRLYGLILVNIQHSILADFSLEWGLCLHCPIRNRRENREGVLMITAFIFINIVASEN